MEKNRYEMPSEEECKEQDCRSIVFSFEKAGLNFRLLRLYRKPDVERDRTEVFLYDFLIAYDYMNAIVEVYNRSGKVHPDYALEKLRNAKRVIDTSIDYFEALKEEMQRAKK